MYALRQFMFKLFTTIIIDFNLYYYTNSHEAKFCPWTVDLFLTQRVNFLCSRGTFYQIRRSRMILNTFSLHLRSLLQSVPNKKYKIYFIVRQFQAGWKLFFSTPFSSWLKIILQPIKYFRHICKISPIARGCPFRCVSVAKIVPRDLGLLFEGKNVIHYYLWNG